MLDFRSIHLEATMRATILLFVLTLSISSPLSAQFNAWEPEPGVRVTPTQFPEWNPDGVAMNDAGQTLVTWSDTRQGTHDIYAQLFDSDGAALWDEDGICIAAFDSPQQDPEVVSVSTTEWIIVWKDYRSEFDSSNMGRGELCAQKINNDGELLWDENGVRLFPENSQMNFHDLFVFNDVADGCVIVANVYQNDVFAQWINSAGAIQWDAEGIDVAERARTFVACSDNNGGFYCIWESSYDSNGIFGEHFSSDGTAQWDNIDPGVRVGADVFTGVDMTVCPDGNGGAFFAWELPASEYSIHGQHVVSPGGTLLWDPEGVSLVNEEQMHQNPLLVPAEPGKCILTWNVDQVNIHVQKIETDGNQPEFLWGDHEHEINGLEVLLFDYTDGSMAVAADETNGVIVTWQQSPFPDFPESNIGYQRVNANGELLFFEDILTPINYRYSYIGNILINTAGFAITWRDSYGDTTGVYSRYFTVDGIPVNDEPFCVMDGKANSKRNLRIHCSNGNPYVTWIDNRFGDEYERIFIQHHDWSTGVSEFPGGGIPVIDSLLNGESVPFELMTSRYAIADDGADGIILVHSSMIGESNEISIGLQRISNYGERLWGDMGIYFDPDPGRVRFLSPRVLLCHSGDNYVTAFSVSSPENYSGIWLYGFDQSGASTWASEPDGIEFTMEGRTGMPDTLFEYSDGSVLLVYEEATQYSQHYGQRISQDGEILWDEDVLIAETHMSIRNPQYLMLRNDLLLFTWWHVHPNEIQLRGQWLYLDGSTSHLPEGERIVGGWEIPEQFAIEKELEWRDYFWLAWQEGEDLKLDCYDDRFQSVLGDEPIVAATSLLGDTHPQLVSDEEGGVYVFWIQEENGRFKKDIRYKHYLVGGNIAHDNYGEDGAILCAEWQDQEDFTAISDGNTGALVAWEDFRPSSVGNTENNCYVMHVDDFTIESDVARDVYRLPDNWSLLPAWPNPFNPSTSIGYTVPSTGNVRISIYDVLGREVVRLVDDVHIAGQYHVQWDGRSAEGDPVASGMYYCRMHSGQYNRANSVILLR